MNQLNQTGSVLIISLIMLIVISMTTVNSMRSNQVQSIMAYNFSDKSEALKVAERSISEVEKWLVKERFSFFDLTGNGCIKTHCFNSNCLNGLCLTAYIDDFGQCVKTNIEPYSDLTIQTQHPLLVDQVPIIVWDNDKYHKQLNQLSKTIKVDAKFIVEFLCFNKALSQVTDNERKNNINWHPVYRVTVKTSGVNSNNKVMLQSLFTVGSL